MNKKKKEIEALKWQTRTNSPRSSFHKGKKQPLRISVFPPRVAATLIVSCSWQQVQVLFSSGFHDASHGRAPRQRCPRYKLVSHLGSSQTRIFVQEVLLFLSLVRSTEANCPLLGLGGKKSAGQIRYSIHVGGGSVSNGRCLRVLWEMPQDGHLKIWPRRKALMSLEKWGDLKQESA